MIKKSIERSIAEQFGDFMKNKSNYLFIKVYWEHFMVLIHG